MTPEQRNELLLRVSHCEIAFYTESTDWRCAGYGEPDKCRDSLVEYVDSIVGAHVQREAALVQQLQEAQRDAARYRALEWKQEADSIGPIFVARVRRNSPKTLFNVGLAIDAAMSKERQP